MEKYSKLLRFFLLYSVALTNFYPGIKLPFYTILNLNELWWFRGMRAEVENSLVFTQRSTRHYSSYYFIFFGFFRNLFCLKLNCEWIHNLHNSMSVCFYVEINILLRMNPFTSQSQPQQGKLTTVCLFLANHLKQG